MTGREPELWLTVDGFSVPVWVSRGSSRPARVVVTSHGLTNNHEDAPLFGDLRSALARADDTTLVEFDYPGSGRADGTLVDKRLSTLRRTLVAVAERTRAELAPGAPLAIVARSMGGTIALSTFPDVRPDRLAVMSPPFALVANIGGLRGLQATDGTYPLPSWAAPSGQVKGETSLCQAFYDELPAEEERLRRGVAEATNVLLVASTEDPKVGATEMEQLWQLLARPGNRREVVAADHNYTIGQETVVTLLTGWITAEEAATA